MALAEIDNLGKYYGATPVITGASFSLHVGDRVGLIGRNGQGKTTLLRLLAGLDHPDGGSIRYAGSTSIEFLTQDAELPGEAVLYDFVLSARQDLIELEGELHHLEAQLGAVEPEDADSAATHELLERYDHARERYQRLGGYRREADAQAVLFGLGFIERDFGLTLGQLSGGQRVRAALARLLLQSPDLLLLDEPTNHLDLEATEWLESFLQDYPGTLVIVSHDRYFLDQVTGRILELNQTRLDEYGGNYSFYEEEREARRKRHRDLYERQQAEIESLKDFIRRYKAGQRTHEARAREHRLEHMDLVERPPSDLPTMVLDFTPARRTGFEVCHVRNLSKGFGAHRLFSGFDAEVYKGQRIGILGPNGSGKSTLLKLLVGELESDSGRVDWGSGVQQGYFNQELDDFVDTRTVVEEFRSCCDLNIPEARHFLASFLFRGDDVFKEIAVLSGGERNRLQLAKLVVQAPNVLLLDEPTNHLDIPSREALEGALCDFDGTVFFVTHDRFLLNRVATNIWELHDCTIRAYKGNYDSVRRKRVEEARRRAAAQGGDPARDRASKPAARQSEGLSVYRLTKLIEDIEEQIAETEKHRAHYEELLARPETYQRADAGEQVERFRELGARLEELYEDWVRYRAELDERR